MAILGPPVGYTDILDYEIEEEIKRQSQDKKPRNPLRPSAAGYCARRLAYDLAQFRGVASYPNRPAMSPSEYRLFELGHSVEYAALRTFKLVKIVQQRYKQQTLSFFPIERIDKTTKEEILEGSCDVVFWSEKWRGVADIKSKGDKFSRVFKTKWDEEVDRFTSFESLERFTETAFWADDLMALIHELGDDFFTDNLYQLNTYARSPFLVERGIDHGIIYRYNKNDSRHMEIRFRPSEEAYAIVQNKFNLVSLAVDEKNPERVARERALGSAACGFCDHRSHCWPDFDALKEHFQTLDKVFPRNISKLKEYGGLRKLFSEYESLYAPVARHDELEKEILALLEKEECRFLRLDNGNCYTVQLLKSPKPHFELRRSKI